MLLHRILATPRSGPHLRVVGMDPDAVDAGVPQAPAVAGPVYPAIHRLENAARYAVVVSAGVWRGEGGKTATPAPEPSEHGQISEAKQMNRHATYPPPPPRRSRLPSTVWKPLPYSPCKH